MGIKLDNLPDWHAEALYWFADNAGRTFPQRPIDVGIGVKVTDPWGKGIRKPAASAYALSVLQTRKGVYADEDPIALGDGSWFYLYHQEGKTAEQLAHPETLKTNLGLLNCKADGIPIGVIVPAASGRGYTVLGLAVVDSFDGRTGLFTLSGPIALEASKTQPAAHAPSVTVALVDFPTGPFDVGEVEDARTSTLAEVRRRQGQPRFRRLMLEAYEGKCAMSEYDAEQALDAAHILSYRGPKSNHPANGLLLRADLHDLFDLGLLAVEVKDMTLLLAAELHNTQYEALAGRPIRIPHAKESRPSEEALDRHRRESRVA